MSPDDPTQAGRIFELETPLGPDLLLLADLEGVEGVSMPFEYRLGLLSMRHDITAEDIVGQTVNISILLADGQKRWINGVVSRFSQTRGGGEMGDDPRFSYYRMIVVPWIWLMTQTFDCRIYQSKTVEEILEDVFKRTPLSDYRILLDGQYEPREYCVQYEETDFNFFSRLCEDEGIFYYFEHERNRHILVLADANARIQPCPGQENAHCQSSGGAWLQEDTIQGLQWTQEITSGRYTLNDYNFTMPSTSLLAEAPSTSALGPGQREIYEYPGGYPGRSVGDRLANIRMQQQEINCLTLYGSSTCRAFQSGTRFRLQGYFREDLDNKELILTYVEHRGSQAGEYIGGMDETETYYQNTFACLPFETPYRPLRKTIKPRIMGAQTAIVVGPSGEEIYTDEHGRIKVQFHWDRQGKRDENSSCWIRVAQIWAGGRWGGLFIPRIGQEVIVDFLEGDPDRPIVIGCVYHGENRPPYDLPGEKNKSTIKSESTIGGGGFNEICFDDTKGGEEIFIHAQRNLSTTVLADESRSVGGSRSTTIHKGDETLVMKEGNRSETLEMGNDTLELQMGSRKTRIQLGNDQLLVSTGNIEHEAPAGTYKITSQAVEITGLTQITLQCGASRIELNPAMVTITGPLVKINC